MSMGGDGICPVCGQPHFGKQEWEVGWRKLSNLGSNALFGECVRITRGPEDSEPFEVEMFEHTAEQTFAYRD